MFTPLLRVIVLTLILYNIVSVQCANTDDELAPAFGLESFESTDRLNSTKEKKDAGSCLTEDNKPGVCVMYFLCDEDHHTVNTNGRGLIDIRAVSMSQRRRREIFSQTPTRQKRSHDDNECESYLDVCCLRPITATESELPPKDGNEGDKTPMPVKPKSSTCGTRKPDGISSTTNGDVNGQARFGEFNWMVAILKREYSDGQELKVYQCGGSLIHPQVVLTAASCVLPSSRSDDVPLPKLIVRAGDWDTSTQAEELPNQDRVVGRISVHPQYDSGGLFNDVALLFLNRSVEIAENVGTICLPHNEEKIAPGTKCFATGWGKDIFGKHGRYQSILKKVELPVVSNADCQQKLRSTHVGKDFLLDKSFVCAGGENGKDTCKGDGGSPLVCPIQDTKNRYVQVGTVSWGVGCGSADVPGVYGNVALFRQWIDATMTKEGYTIDN